MPLYTTNDPVKRAEHIANMENSRRENKLKEIGEFRNYPAYWLGQYQEASKELNWRSND